MTYYTTCGLCDDLVTKDTAPPSHIPSFCENCQPVVDGITAYLYTILEELHLEDGNPPDTPSSGPTDAPQEDSNVIAQRQAAVEERRKSWRVIAGGRGRLRPRLMVGEAG